MIPMLIGVARQAKTVNSLSFRTTRNLTALRRNVTLPNQRALCAKSPNIAEHAFMTTRPAELQSYDLRKTP